MTAAYREDLARIHDAGFGHIARAAARALIAGLADDGLEHGMIVELGCGSGITSRMLVDAGFDVCGYDVSPEMLALARERVPEARFTAASWLDLTELPACVAVTGIGEVLSYGLDSAASPAGWPRLFRTVHHALERGGSFLFDVAGYDRAPRGVSRSFVEGEDWAVLVETDLDADAGSLVRRITSFRDTGGFYRRDFEEHRLHLCEPAMVTGELEQAGFSVTARKDYGDLALPEGLTAFVARRM